MNKIVCLFATNQNSGTIIQLHDGSERSGTRLSGTIYQGADVKGTIAAVSCRTPSSVNILDIAKDVILQVIEPPGTEKVDWTTLSDNLEAIAYCTNEGLFP
jgi:hypothetical protein